MSQSSSLGEEFAWEVCNTGALFDQFQILQTLSFNSFCSCSWPSLYLVLVVVRLPFYKPQQQMQLSRLPNRVESCK